MQQGEKRVSCEKGKTAFRRPHPTGAGVDWRRRPQSSTLLLHRPSAQMCCVQIEDMSRIRRWSHNRCSPAKAVCEIVARQEHGWEAATAEIL